MSRIYEVMFIVHPGQSEEEVDKLIAQFQATVASTHGEVVKVEKMGKRKLAYRVEKCTEGYYVLFTVKAMGETVREFERRLRVTDAVLKYLTVRVDEELKRLEKMKALREKRATRRAAKNASKSVAAPPPEVAEPENAAPPA